MGGAGGDATMGMAGDGSMEGDVSMGGDVPMGDVFSLVTRCCVTAVYGGEGVASGAKLASTSNDNDTVPDPVGV